MPTNATATVSNAVATGRRMNGSERFIWRHRRRIPLSATMQANRLLARALRARATENRLFPVAQQNHLAISIKSTLSRRILMNITQTDYSAAAARVFWRSRTSFRAPCNQV